MLVLNFFTWNDLSKPILFFFFHKLKHSMDINWQKDPLCKAKPLFDIPLDHVIVDELHMFLRVMDILEKDVIFEVINWDEVHVKT